MTWSLLLAVASAGSVESGWALYRVGAYDDAAALAARHVTEDPGAIGWQRLYARSRARVDGDRAVIGQYRRWLAEAPEDPIRRVMLADVLAHAWRFDGSWCDEIEALLSATPSARDARFWTHVVRQGVRTNRCRGDAATDAAAVLALASEVDGGVAIALPLAIADGVEPHEVEWIRHALAEDPDLLGRMVPLFEASGPGVKRARRVVIKAAKAAIDSDLPGLFAAFEVLEAAGDAASHRADERLAVLHPDPHRFGPAREISRARRHADPIRALAQVEALESTLPDDPEVLARFHTARGDLLRKAGDPDRATEAYREAWQATPDDADRANFFAYHATLTGAHLDEALVAATAAVQGFQSERFSDRPWPGETFAEWRARSAERVGEALDTRGWTLHLLGRDTDAAPDLLQASRLVDNPVVDLHVGFVLVALGEVDAAAPHLARGTRERDPAEQGAVRQGWDALRSWWTTAGMWHPGGIEGWVADVSGEPPPTAQLSDPSSLVGQRLPDVAVRVGGESVRLGDVEGPAVIDVWATWCRPCVEALPEVERLSLAYPGVRFLAVSVDDKASAVDAFFEGMDRPSVPLGWWSSEESPYELLGIAGVPSLFVVDSENRVAAYLLGADVNRLGAAVEAVAETAE